MSLFSIVTGIVGCLLLIVPVASVVVVVIIIIEDVAAVPFKTVWYTTVR